MYFVSYFGVCSSSQNFKTTLESNRVDSKGYKFQYIRVGSTCDEQTM